MGERYFDQATQNGHDTRPGDLGHLQSLGVSALRYPVLWERVAPQGPEHADWMPGLVFGLACIDTESARVPEAPEVNLGPLLMEVRERPTAVAAMLRGLAAGRVITHPAALGQGWWRRDTRYVVPGASQVASTGNTMQSSPGDAARPPILISGASGTLGLAFARICAERNLACQLVGRAEMDITDPDAVERALDKYRPWALINASGYVRVDEAEHDTERCFRENAYGPQVLAAACARHGIHLTTFSSDLVFDGRADSPYVEADDVSPINVYGRSKADGEQAVLARTSNALVIRTSGFFGPWDRHNFIHHALGALEAGIGFAAPGDVLITPTYLPDLVDTCLNLVIDGECGVWHLTNTGAVSWIELARMAAARAGLDPAGLRAQRVAECRYAAARPANSALHSSRANLLPTLHDALARMLAQRALGAGAMHTPAAK